MKSPTVLFAENLRALRKASGLTQRELGEAIGYSEKAVSKWESGAAVAPGVLLPRLARVLGATIDALFAEKGEILYYLGIDGGATKTEFLLTDAEGRTLARSLLGAANPNDVGLEAMRTVLGRGIAEVVHGYPLERISVFAGIAGGITGNNGAELRAFLEGYRFGAIASGSDAENAVSAALGHGDGIAVILGTGSIAFAKREGRLHRFGGFGYLFGDEGSGFALGRDAIAAALHDEEGSGPATTLTAAVAEELGGGTVLPHLGELYRGGKRAVAQLAPLVFAAHAGGDAVATGILRRGMHAIAELILVAATPFGEEAPLTVRLCGGVSHRYKTLLPMIKEALGAAGSRFRIDRCERPMVQGALLLAGLKEETLC